MSRCLVSLLLFFLFQSTFAQTTLVFPRMASEQGTYTGFTISNPTDHTAEVELTAYDENGNVISSWGAENPLKMTLAPRNQLSGLDFEFFNFTQPVSGWVQAVSSTSGLTGFFLLGTDNGDSLDGAETPPALTHFLFPFIAQEHGGTTEITLINPNREEAGVTLNGFSSDGEIIAGKELNLPPMGLLRGSIDDLFPSTPHLITHVRGSASQPVIGFELVQNFSLPPSLPSKRRDAVGLNAVPALAEGKTGYFPHFFTSPEFFSFVGLVNLSSSAQNVTLTAFDSNGTPLKGGAITNPRTIDLAGNGSVRLTVKELFNLPDTANGWIRVDTETGGVTDFIGYGGVSTSSFAVAASQTEPQRRSVFSQVALGLKFFTGIGLLNPNNTPAKIEVFFLRDNGSTVGIYRTTLSPNQKVTKLLHELIPEAQDQVGGFIYIKSDQPVFGTQLLGSIDERALVNVPAQAVTEPISPGDKDTWINTDLGDEILWRYGEFSELAGGRQVINVIVIPTTAHIAPRLTNKRTTSQAAEQIDTKAATNAGYFDAQRNPLSLVKIDGTQVANNARTRSVFAVLESDAGQRVIRLVDRNAQFAEAYQAIGGGPRLILDGKIYIPYQQEGFSSAFVNSKQPRTGLGVGSDGVVFLVTVDGRGADGSLGITLQEFADLLLKLGSQQAFNLDGGGSTTMWIRGYGVVNNPSSGSEKRVSDILIVW